MYIVAFLPATRYTNVGVHNKIWFISHFTNKALIWVYYAFVMASGRFQTLFRLRLWMIYLRFTWSLFQILYFEIFEHNMMV